MLTWEFNFKRLDFERSNGLPKAKQRDREGMEYPITRKSEIFAGKRLKVLQNVSFLPAEG